MKVSIIIVTYNALKWIEKCINSIKESTIEATIIIVDNKSTDETVNYLKDNFGSEILLIESSENLGFGKGNNLGLKLAVEINSDYVFLLNQDTIITKNSLQTLVNTAILNPEYGILSPIHLNYEGSELEYYFSNYVHFYKTPHFLFDTITKNELKPVYQTKFVNAAAWLIPINVLKIVGGFDPIFWHYGEDDNYGQRINYNGFKIGIVPNTFIFHDSKERAMPQDFLFSKKYYLNYEKNILIKYANIINKLRNNNFNEERNTILFEVFLNILKFNFKYAFGEYKKIKLLKKTFNNIKKSRTKNINSTTEFKYIK